MNITRLAKQHPVLSFCLLTLLWSFSWWSLIPVVIPIGTVMAMPQNPLVLALMVISGVRPSLVELGLIGAILFQLAITPVSTETLACPVFALALALLLRKEYNRCSSTCCA